MKPSTGKIKFFNDEKGYGFIVADNSSKDLFFHITSFTTKMGDARNSQLQDKKVSFQTREGKKGPEAIDVALIQD